MRMDNSDANNILSSSFSKISFYIKHKYIFFKFTFSYPPNTISHIQVQPTTIGLSIAAIFAISKLTIYSKMQYVTGIILY